MQEELIFAVVCCIFGGIGQSLYGLELLSQIAGITNTGWMKNLQPVRVRMIHKKWTGLIFYVAWTGRGSTWSSSDEDGADIIYN